MQSSTPFMSSRNDEKPLKNPRRLSTTSIVVLCIGFNLSAWAVGSGSMQVRVYGADGDPMQDVHVSLYWKGEKPPVGDARTDDKGLVPFQDLAPGRGYEIRAAKPGYATVVIPHIEARSRYQTSVPLTLRRKDTPPGCILRIGGASGRTGDGD
jgi:hypothetical protein